MLAYFLYCVWVAGWVSAYLYSFPSCNNCVYTYVCSTIVLNNNDVSIHKQNNVTSSIGVIK